MNLGFKIAFLQGGSPLTRRWAFAPGENQRFAWARARSLQQKAAAARTAEEQPVDALEASGTARSSQQPPGTPQGHDRTHGGHRTGMAVGVGGGQQGTTQEAPGAARTAEEQPTDALEASGAARSSQRQPRSRPRTPGKSQRQPRSSQEQLADSQEPPGAARSSQEPPGATRAGFRAPGGS